MIRTGSGAKALEPHAITEGSGALRTEEVIPAESSDGDQRTLCRDNLSVPDIVDGSFDGDLNLPSLFKVTRIGDSHIKACAGIPTRRLTLSNNQAIFVVDGGVSLPFEVSSLKWVGRPVTRR